MKQKLIKSNDKRYYPTCCNVRRCGGRYSIVYTIKHLGASLFTCANCPYRVDLRKLYI